jgi:DNA mismatch endonuclease (patch repair protein)
MTREKRSVLMSKIRGKNTGLELIVLKRLRKLAIPMRLHSKSLPGKPDVVFPDVQVALFIDGDFWHGWRFPAWRSKLSPFWQKKIDDNMKRDRRTIRRLRRLGWLVIRIWEHQVKRDIELCVNRVLELRKCARGIRASRIVRES